MTRGWRCRPRCRRRTAAPAGHPDPVDHGGHDDLPGLPGLPGPTRRCTMRAASRGQAPVHHALNRRARLAPSLTTSCPRLMAAPSSRARSSSRRSSRRCGIGTAHIGGSASCEKSSCTARKESPEPPGRDRHWQLAAPLRQQTALVAVDLTGHGPSRAGGGAAGIAGSACNAAASSGVPASVAA